MDTVKCNKIGKGAMRVTIPSWVRKELCLAYGDEFIVSTDGNKVLFEKVTA